MKYRGSIGRASFNQKAGFFHGTVVNIHKDVVTFQGKTQTEAKQAFIDSVEDYLAFCLARKERPEPPLPNTHSQA